MSTSCFCKHVFERAPQKTHNKTENIQAEFETRDLGGGVVAHQEKLSAGDFLEDDDADFDEDVDLPVVGEEASGQVFGLTLLFVGFVGFVSSVFLFFQCFAW